MSESSTTTLTCGDCGLKFEGGSRAKRCDPCRAEDRKVKVRDRMRAWRATQPQAEHPDPVCQDCGITFRNPNSDGRQTKKYCDDCLAVRVRENSRKAYLKRTAQNPTAKMVRTCLDCPADLTGAPARRLRCEPCGTADRDAKMRTYLREWKRAQPKTAFRCRTCDVAIDREGKSGVATYCGACRPVAVKRTRRRADAKKRERVGTTYATHCHYCNVEFDKPRRRSRFPSSCIACQRQRHYAYMRGRATERIASAKCGDCGKPVNSKRKGPRKRCADCRKLRQLERWRIYGRKFNHIRRDRMRAAGSERFNRLEVFDRDSWRCGICGRKVRKDIKYPHPLSVALDHKIPLGAGVPADHSRLNAQPAHKVCNEMKGNRVLPVQLLLFA